MIFKPQSAADVQDILHGSGSYCICGTGSKSMFGPPTSADNTIDLSEMSGIVDWSPDDLVVTAKAGTTIAEIDAELAAKAQMIGVPTFASELGRLTAGIPGTLGGLISANLPTRWESACRGPRYWTLGLTMIRANRDLVKCGSRAVKNVAGYDVQKLIVGAWGTLGVITEVTLRTQPLKQFDDEPKSEWGGEPPFCIARTLPTGVDDYISANPIHDPIIDRGTGTIWARAIKPAAKPKNGWVINAGFGENDRSQLGENEDIMREIKQKLDPLNRFNSREDVLNEAELYDKTVKCIRCGFCLEACPTFRITGQETESPRGRIYLVRSAIEGELEWNDTRKHLDLCLGCRACETACPSGVEYGDILEMAREKLEPTRPLFQRIARATLIASITGYSKPLAKLPFRKVPAFFSRLLSGEEPEAELPATEAPNTFPTHANAGSKGSVNLLTGCVMDSLYHTTNQAVRYLLERQGYKVVELSGICCGALHKHAGRPKREPRFPPGPIIVTSAGCGSSLKDRGYPAKDITEFLHETDFQPSTTGDPITIVYQDACHLLHGQKIAEQPRWLLDRLPGVTRIEIEDPGACCGSAGIYNITQPAMARTLLEQKWRAIEAANPEAVVTANPGCLAWLSQAAREKNSPIRVIHIARFIAERCHNKQA